ATGARLEDTSEELGAQRRIVGLIGTMRKSTGKMVEAYQRPANHIAIHWAWSRGENINTSCGVSLLLAHSRYRISHISLVHKIPKGLWGRSDTHNKGELVHHARYLGPQLSDNLGCEREVQLRFQSLEAAWHN
ncbi:MAG: hypothetical protein ACKPKO_58105, partial [Candidatus Fonsibacter sp.]